MGKKNNIILENIRVEDYAAEGKSLARVEGKVIFIEKAVPGDIVDIRLTKNKKEWAEGHAVSFHSLSADRIEPFCSHFGVCGGCQWQMLPYEKQLQYKQKQVEDALTRIGKIQLPPVSRIIGADLIKFYRNKLEYTFSTREFTPDPPGPSSPSPTLPQGKGHPRSAQKNNLSFSSPIERPGLRKSDVKSFNYHTADPSVYGLMKEYAIIQKQNQTQAEAALWQLLKGKKLSGHKFRRQHIILHFIADFVCLSKKLIIELDGNIHDNPENKISDQERTSTLNAKGYHVLRFSNSEVLSDPESVLNRITEALNHLPEVQSNNEDVEAPSFGGGLGEAAGASGFHARGFFDKVVEIEKCWLQEEPTNIIRNTIAGYARKNKYSFYDFKTHLGSLRNVQVRICTTGEVMVNVIFGPGSNNEDTEEIRKSLLDHLLQTVPGITTLLYTINTKFNDSLYDLEPVPYYGKGFIMEKLTADEGEEFYFRIGPKSFFQTNTRQAEKLYQVTKDFACLSGKETVYDLYCGTGSIGIFLSNKAKKIVGVDVMESAINDARENASLNRITHAEFITGDVITTCNDDFFSIHGHPDVIISDPPRAGMHEKLVKKILDMSAPVVVYVSCNPSTQARDLAILDEKYRVTGVQPVDMFPHTHHIENVVQLKLK